jgi:hypothetical protein
LDSFIVFSVSIIIIIILEERLLVLDTSALLDIPPTGSSTARQIKKEAHLLVSTNTSVQGG